MLGELPLIPHLMNVIEGCGVGVDGGGVENTGGLMVSGFGIISSSSCEPAALLHGGTRCCLFISISAQSCSQTGSTSVLNLQTVLFPESSFILLRVASH